MKKINNKGYMLVEIIVAAVIAFSIAYYLLNLIVKFKNINEDIYFDTEITNIKINTIKSIKEDLAEESRVRIYEIDDESEDKYYINMEVGEDNRTKRIEIDKINKVIEYGLYKDKEFDKKDISHYKKKFPDFVDINIKIDKQEFPKIEVEGVNKSLLGKVKKLDTEIIKDYRQVTITIKISNIYTDYNDNITLFIYSYNNFEKLIT